MPQWGLALAAMHAMSRQGNSLDAAEVNAALRHTAFAGTVRHLREVISTNDLAIEAAQAGTCSGVWVADTQTGGRGRGGHRWLSAPGDGLYMSALCSPRLPASVVELSLAAGLSAWEAVREVTGLVTDIRWPNDLVTRDEAGSRKLGGILTETAALGLGSSVPATLRYAVIGIGLNVGHRAFPPDLADTATSLYLEGWQVPDRQPLLIALLQHLARNLERLEEEYLGGQRSSQVLGQLTEASTWLVGKRVHVAEGEGYTGVTAGLDSKGFLLVDSDDGLRRTVRSGGVREIFGGRRL